MDLRKPFYEHIVLSGASTMFPGYASRLLKEMINIYIEKGLENVKDKTVRIEMDVIDSPRRKYSVFIGASIIGNYYNTADSEDYWVTIDEWLECGENAVNKENLIKNKIQSYFKDNISTKKK